MMQLTLPGTTVEIGSYSAAQADALLRNVFLTGGLTLSQLSAMTGLSPHDVQNWVKRGFLPPPRNRLYTRRQFTRVAIIHMLRESMQIENVLKLLVYINGKLDDESDDLIDECRLYSIFVDLLGQLGGTLPERDKLSCAVDACLGDFREPVSGTARRVADVLMIMVYAWFAARAKSHAETLMRDITDSIPAPSRATKN